MQQLAEGSIGHGQLGLLIRSYGRVVAIDRTRSLITAQLTSVLYPDGCVLSIEAGQTACQGILLTCVPTGCLLGRSEMPIQ